MDSYYARQPIFNLNNDTIAYELLFRNSGGSTSYSFNSGEGASLSVINSAFLGADLRSTFRNKKIYINFTESLILKDVVTILPKDMLVVEILEDVNPTPEVIEKLKEYKEKGYRMAVDDFIYSDENSVFLEYAEIVKIDFRSPKEDIERTAEICRKLKKRILAEKIETAEELEYAKSLGAIFFQGYYFSRPLLISLKNPNPLQITFMQLMVKLIDEDVHLGELSKIIRTDSGMTLKFLRFVNLQREDHLERIKSVHQAVTAVGLRRTKDFIYLLSLHTMNENFIDEMITTGFFRAKFCESISGLLFPNNNKQKEEMYLLGLISIIIDCNAETENEEIDVLPLSDNIKDGLHRIEDNLFGDTLRAAIAFENADWDSLDEFCKKYEITSADISKINLRCIMHTNELIKNIRF
ncbi:MAG: EAL domain-containing protein [Ruminococcus sp.]|nr:EAL domain-containing protein [Ruminococcus sp.]MBR6670760.1 EAL domain-containing protein [Ruminococcus sp.]